MEYLERSFATAHDNLAYEEALLGECERTGRESLLVWEPPSYAVVAGYSNRAFEDVRLDVCERLGIPVLRRHSGGGTVLIGPGCLNYALILGIGQRPGLSSIRETNRHLMRRLSRAVGEVSGAAVSVRGHTDLALGDRKVSGNAQYRRRSAVLFHGTLMRAMDIDLIEQTLALPSRAPTYRRNRAHRAFLTNLPVPSRHLRDALRREFIVLSDRPVQSW